MLGLVIGPIDLAMQRWQLLNAKRHVDVHGSPGQSPSSALVARLIYETEIGEPRRRRRPVWTSWERRRRAQPPT
jgi:hypothetical protein